MIDVRYTVGPGRTREQLRGDDYDSRTLMKLNGDEFSICEAVRERLFPLESLPKKDAKFEKVMRERAMSGETS